MRLWLAALAILLVCTPAAFGSRRSQREHGAALFSESGCLHCHTIRNHGGSKGPDLSGVGRRLKEAQMRHQIVNGSKLMPPFGEVIEGNDLTDLLSYLHSCRDKVKK
jgi:mono/diheme cytochrome c family protein